MFQELEIPSVRGAAKYGYRRVNALDCGIVHSMKVDEAVESIAPMANEAGFIPILYMRRANGIRLSGEPLYNTSIFLPIPWPIL